MFKTNVRRARKGTNLPQKQAPSFADFLVGIGDDGSLFRTPSDSVGGVDIGALPARGSPVGSDRFPLQTTAGTDYRTTFTQMIAALVNQITTAQINELLRTEVALEVSNTGVITNLSGRLQITGGRTAQGTYTLTAPAGWVWQSAIGGGVATTDRRSINCAGSGTRTLTVHTFNQNNAKADFRFLLLGTLR